MTITINSLPLIIAYKRQKHDQRKTVEFNLVMNITVPVEECCLDQSHHQSDSLTGGKDGSLPLPWY